MKWFTLLICMSLISSAYAASFNCHKAETSIEKTICSDAVLSKLDDEMSSSYKVVMQKVNQSASIRKLQKNWLAERNNCSTIDCLNASYKRQLVALKSHIDLEECKILDTSTQGYDGNVSLSLVKEQCGPDTGFTFRFTVLEKAPEGNRTLLVLSNDTFEFGAFQDIDSDKVPEIVFSDGSNAANSSFTIYHYSLSTHSLKKVLEFSGTSIHKFDGYFVTDYKDWAAGRSAEAFKILDEKNLIVESSPRFRMSSELGTDMQGKEFCTCQFIDTRVTTRNPIAPPNKSWNKYCFFYEETGPHTCKLKGKNGRVTEISRN